LTSLRLLSSQLFALRIEVETADELGNAGQGNQGLVGRAPLAVGEQVDAQLAQALLGSNMLWAKEDSSLILNKILIISVNQFVETKNANYLIGVLDSIITFLNVSY